ncbi:hypothetical protein AVEN_184179-1 [Araneus ventricosus]|uniref:Uncharacterized protein n=1 Tax=Araneus ventricosus TaxID=182803 RepID=A0A4Y2IA86_ARAVE|nr:hypothetical protein AVEN_184179-1 [Araneus ventricosus]
MGRITVEQRFEEFLSNINDIFCLTYNHSQDVSQNFTTIHHLSSLVAIAIELTKFDKVFCHNKDYAHRVPEVQTVNQQFALVSYVYEHEEDDLICGKTNHGFFTWAIY